MGRNLRQSYLNQYMFSCFLKGVTRPSKNDKPRAGFSLSRENLENLPFMNYLY